MTGDPPSLPDDQRLIDEDTPSLYEEAPCGYLYSRPDGTLLRVNRTFLNWTGFDRREVEGRRFQDLLSVGGKIFHETHFAPLLRMQGFVTEIALDIITKSGAVLPVLVNSVQKRDGSGSPVLNRTTVFNVTERRKYERELQLARQRAEESARSKSELLSTISHDIRSPLGAILAAAELLGRSGLTPPQKTYVRVLRSSSEALLNLVNSVLNLRGLESGHVTLERRPFDLRQLVLDVMATLNVRAEAKQLPLEVNIDREVPQAVMGDPVKIGQILTNLVANAVKFTEQGSVTVGVRVNRQTDDHIDLDFTVADTGIGIPADRLPYIFEDFTQASYDVGATYGGSGLGLAIVRRLLALHGSRITVESDVNRGSVFRFSLGFDTVREETPAARHIGGDAAIAETRLLSGLRVLLVEDNSFDAFVVGRALESWDVRYDVSPTVRESTEKMRTATYDAVLLNVRAADGDVRAATTAILAASSDEGRTPLVLALTPSAEEAAEIANEDSPLMDAVTKPVDPSVLYAKLAAARE